jgi:hypothetical protein
LPELHLTVVKSQPDRAFPAEKIPTVLAAGSQHPFGSELTNARRPSLAIFTDEVAGPREYAKPAISAGKTARRQNCSTVDGQPASSLHVSIFCFNPDNPGKEALECRLQSIADAGSHGSLAGCCRRR